MNEGEIPTVEKPSSVEFSRSAKGAWSFKVKAYGENTELAQAEAMDVANKCEVFCNKKNELELLNGI